MINNFKPTPNQVLDVEIYIGKKLREQRRALKLNQHQLAHKIGVTGQQIHKYEKGIDRISASRLYEIAKILAVPIHFFYQDLDASFSKLNSCELVVTCANLGGKQIRVEFLNLKMIPS